MLIRCSLKAQMVDGSGFGQGIAKNEKKKGKFFLIPLLCVADPPCDFVMTEHFSYYIALLSHEITCCSSAYQFDFLSGGINENSYMAYLLVFFTRGPKEEVWFNSEYYSPHL